MNDESEPAGESPRRATGEIIAVSAVSCFPAGSPRSSPEPAGSYSPASKALKLDLSGLPAADRADGSVDHDGEIHRASAAGGDSKVAPGPSLADSRGDPLSNDALAAGAGYNSSAQEVGCLSPNSKKVMIIEEDKSQSGSGLHESPAGLAPASPPRRGSCLRDPGRAKRGTGTREESASSAGLPQRKPTEPKLDDLTEKAGPTTTGQGDRKGSRRAEPPVDPNRKQSRNSVYCRLSSRSSDSSPRQLLRESLAKPRPSKGGGREPSDNLRRTSTKTGDKRKSTCSKRRFKSNSRTRATAGQPGGLGGSGDEGGSADEDESSEIEEIDTDERQAGNDNEAGEKASIPVPQMTQKDAGPVEIELEPGKDDMRNTDECELRFNMRTGKFSRVVVPKPALAPVNRSAEDLQGGQTEWIFPWEVRRDIDVFALSASAFDRRQRNSVWDRPGDLPGSRQHSANQGSPPKSFLQRFQDKEMEENRQLDDVLKEGKTDFFYECLRKMSEANEWSQLMDMNCVYRAFKSRDGRLACHVYDGKSYIKRLPIEVSCTSPLSTVDQTSSPEV